MLIYFLTLARSGLVLPPAPGIQIELRPGKSSIICPNFETNVLSDDWTVNDPREMINTISQKYSIEPDELANFFNLARFATSSKHAFHRFSMDMPDHEHRSSLLESSIIKVARSNGQYIVSVRKAYAKGLFSYIVHARLAQYYVWLAELRTFEAGVLERIYSYSENAIRGAVEQFKNI